MKHRITLPFPPTVNHYWKTTFQRGRVIHYVAPKGKQFRNVALYACRQQKAPRNLAGFLACRVELYPPDRRRRDIDNYHKAALDALGYAKVYGDDSQIKDMQTIMREKDPAWPDGCAVITLWKMGEGDGH